MIIKLIPLELNVSKISLYISEMIDEIAKHGFGDKINP